MDSFPEDFNFISVKSQLRDAREYIYKCFKDSKEQNHFLIDLSKYDTNIRKTLLSELSERFPHIGYESNAFYTPVTGFTIQSRSLGYVRYIKNSDFGSATIFVVAKTEEFGKNLEYIITREDSILRSPDKPTGLVRDQSLENPEIPFGYIAPFRVFSIL